MKNLPKSVVAILIISLSLNLLVVGIFVGRAIYKPMGKDFRRIVSSSFYHQIVRALPNEQRRNLKKSFKERNKKEFRKLSRTDNFNQISKLEQVLLKTKINESALKSILESDHTKFSKRHALFTKGIIIEILSMNLEEREMFVTRLRQLNIKQKER